MKKQILITISVILVAVPLLLGGVLGIAYFSVGADSVPAFTVEYNGQQIAPVGYEWHQPVLSGLLYREFVQSPSLSAADIGTITEDEFTFTLPAELEDAAVTVTKDGETYWQGSPDDWGSVTFPRDGAYIMEITAALPKENISAYGSFTFRLAFTMELAPVLNLSSNTLEQGDAMAVHFKYLPEGVQPYGETEFAALHFISTGERAWVAYFAASYMCDPGEYTLWLEAGEQEWEIPLTVAAYTFPQEDLIIDMTNPDNAAAKTPEAAAQYNNAIIPTFSVADETRHWEGTFAVPAEGRIGTHYGTRRYVNGETYPSAIHKGMDIAADMGAPVSAPNGGRVVYADFLLSTGNTLVIEHGGGLKSYFYHLSEMHVQAGDLVEKGELVALVGSTGYSTGPHLHYEVRVRSNTFDPERLLDGSSQIFYQPARGDKNWLAG